MDHKPAPYQGKGSIFSKQVANDKRQPKSKPKFLSRSSSQFASSPRFVFNQRKARSPKGNRIANSRNPTTSARPGQIASLETRRPTVNREHVIPDSDESDEDEVFITQASVTSRFLSKNEDRDSNTLDEDADSPLRPSPKRYLPKRRRLSISSTNSTEEYETAIKGSQRAPDAPSPSLGDPEASSLSQEALEDIASPKSRRVFSTPIQAPGESAPRPLSALGERQPSSSRSTALRNAWQLSSRVNLTNAKHSSAQPKPRFILPQTPHRSREYEVLSLLTSPVPFRYLKRQRRPKPLTFVAGGMASELQSWVFELGLRRQVNREQRARPQLKGQSAMIFDESHVIAPIREVRILAHPVKQTLYFGHPAPFALIAPPQTHTTAALPYKIALFHTPQSFSLSTIQEGKWVRIRRNLSWEIELEGPNLLKVAGKKTAVAENETKEQKKGHNNAWLVGLDWQVI